MEAPNRTWAEVDLDCIAHNYAEFNRVTGHKAQVMCVIKANAYGHGSVALAKRLSREGCRFFGVAALDEALELRYNGIKEPILVLNHIAPERVSEASVNDITLTVFTKEMADDISQKALKPVKVHIKTDTGMTRVGFNPDGAADAAAYISKLDGIELEGIYTHFSSADETDRAYTEMQIGRFNAITDAIAAKGVTVRIKHAANSAGTIMYPEAHFDMVRAGISLYGCYPSEEVDKSRIDLWPAMSLKSTVVRVNRVPEGVPVSYGRLFTTQRPSRLATIPVGYADGISRVLAKKLHVLIGCERVPVVGKICMDQCVADVTDIPTEVKNGDEAVIFGRQGKGFIPVESVAAQMGTINYEILCAVSRRVPRYYVENGRIVSCSNFLLDVDNMVN